MRCLPIATFLSAVMLGITPAWAQFGLYGSPEVLRLPQVQPLTAPDGSNPSPGAYPADATPRPMAAAYVPQRPSSGPSIQRVGADSPAPLSSEVLPAEPADSAMPAKGPNVVNQMLSQPGAGGYYADNGSGAASCGCTGSDGSRCVVGPPCNDGCECSPWYASTNGLIMTRNRGNRVWTSYLDSVLTDQLANTDDVHMNWQGGAEICVGRRFCCGQWGLEGIYWGLLPAEESLTLSGSDGHGLATPLNDGFLDFDGTPIDAYFGNDALQHRLWRRNEFHNVEINAIRNRLCCACDNAWGVDVLAGFRFFRFQDSFSFASVQAGGSWSDPDTVAMLDNNVTNNLWGFQLGFNADYRFAENWRVFATPKVGIYDNHATHDFNIHLANGTPASGEYGSFPVSGSSDTVSFLTEIDVGLDWRFAERWSAQVGYRVVAVTGVGLIENQMPQYLVDLPEIAHLKTNGDLLLHGAFAGLTYNF